MYSKRAFTKIRGKSMKNYLWIIGIFAMYALAFVPLFLLTSHLPPELANNNKILLIINSLMAGTVICLFLSLLAIVLRWYRTSLFIAVIPVFAVAVLICSALLLLLFHKEISHAFVVGKIRAAGTALTNIIKLPFTLLPK